MKKNKAATDVAIIAIFFAIMLVINFLTSLVFNLWPVPIKLRSCMFQLLSLLLSMDHELALS